MGSGRADRQLDVYRLGRIDYAAALAIQERLVEARIESRIEDTLLILEHDPVITLGAGGKPEHLLGDRAVLDARGIGLFACGRGGDATYHGPGQLVVYPIIALAPRERDVRRYVWKLEEVMVRMAVVCGLAAKRIEGLRGVWIEDRKLGAVGVRIRRWVTLHGLALNVNTDLDAFQLIVPCGIRDRGVTSLERELGRRVDMEEVSSLCVETFSRLFERRSRHCHGYP